MRNSFLKSIIKLSFVYSVNPNKCFSLFIFIIIEFVCSLNQSDGSDNQYITAIVCISLLLSGVCIPQRQKQSIFITKLCIGKSESFRLLPRAYTYFLLPSLERLVPSARNLNLNAHITTIYWLQNEKKRREQSNIRNGLSKSVKRTKFHSYCARLDFNLVYRIQANETKPLNKQRTQPRSGKK